MSTTTAPQIKFYNSLLDQIMKLAPQGAFDPAVIAACRENYPALTVAQASDAIERAKRTVAHFRATPATVVAAAPVAVSVPSGHYALTIDGTVKFFRVNSPTEGKWAGRTFVDVQASDEYFKAGREYSAKVLAAIAADPKAAMSLYGLSLGRCGHCHKTLTNEISRQTGIGPVCARKMGW